MYLNNRLIEIDHICCMVHARAKFQYAWEVASVEDVKYVWNRLSNVVKIKKGQGYYRSLSK